MPHDATVEGGSAGEGRSRRAVGAVCFIPSMWHRQQKRAQGAAVTGSSTLPSGGVQLVNESGRVPACSSLPLAQVV
jgi:hypothetical protein